jgi:hypothetical protein
VASSHRGGFSSPFINSIVLPLVLLTLVLSAGGCARKNTVKAYLPDFERGRLVNTALLIPYINASQRAGGQELDAFHERIIDELRNDCKGLRLLTTNAPGMKELLPRLAAALSERDVVGFSEAARMAGIASIVTGRIAEVAADERSWGFWLLRDTNYYLTVQVDTTIFDVETGSKKLDASLTEEIGIDGLEYDAMVLGQSTELSDVDKLLDELAEDSAARACKALSKQPWIGFVTAIDKEQVTLVPGEAAGLKAGMKLHIYDSGTVVDGAMGYRYFVPGLKNAEIEITSVGPASAQARILSGKMIAPGDSVRLLD